MTCLSPSSSRSSSFARQQQLLSKRPISSFPDKKGLYDPMQEKDSCGVGLVAQLKKQANRQIVIDANEMLVRMSHRGGCGCEPNTGDGAGMLVGIPDAFLRKVRCSVRFDISISIYIVSYSIIILLMHRWPNLS